ncbi:hypothetical protein QBC43DRAFT_350889 [Cladorrhinum sp. PSN259]|nr:hypothetical protein QBC43DRAFT_350889 [Cladorrhinum sp. PSN259]
MRLLLLNLAVVFLTTTAQAQANKDCTSVALQAIPSCAQPCFVNKAPEIGCGGLDFVCQCQKQAALYAAIEGCVVDSCPSSQYQAVIDGAGTVCECAVVASPAYTVSGSYVSHISSASSIPASSIPAPSILPSVSASSGSGSGSGFGSGTVEAAPTGAAFPAATPPSSNNAGYTTSPPSRVGMMGVSAYIAALAFALL